MIDEKLIKEKIKFAESCVKGFDEPFKSIAFKVLLEKSFNELAGPNMNKAEKDMLLPIAIAQTEPTTLPGFMRKMNTKSHIDKVLAIVYFLTQRQSLDAVTVSDIEESYRKSLLKPSTNTNYMLNIAVSRGYLMELGDREGKKSWTITQDGIDLMEKLLSEEKHG